MSPVTNHYPCFEEQAHDLAVRSMVWSHNENWMVTGDDGGCIKWVSSSRMKGWYISRFNVKFRSQVFAALYSTLHKISQLFILYPRDAFAGIGRRTWTMSRPTKLHTRRQCETWGTLECRSYCTVFSINWLLIGMHFIIRGSSVLVSIWL